ncbi:YhgE/Pip domain-containing protein [Pediococcus claussenii]|uniref:ABC-2 type transporter transmembrane domain-containing protein n=1 Tax=Pediococcus claussenii (strain ATCC BAA-344 / DSM 14800 / JCM 18046 / KCTC 3811 / LMG 21948 / P06) TaxID=701521 RepID=G8PEA4_PEDCP|nr:ABC transporter permease [Pediococcus claussenii]AEV94365.1 hypothetical protein PECL_27 [Pediococcus claussenii ATCC BAA-344]ANZ69587.1 hypothetical protein AYR57_04325 [Pediococcus claussenii]ANZ71404.1 hypothetical protein AYR58_04330 [Pediococcus claussenii]KRN19373.1 hypothetical protein IV79_GL001424 [Pediococcus claussenii]
MKQLKNFLVSRGVISALVLSLFYGFLVFVIYFTGYHAMPSKMNELPIAIVNQDSASKHLANQLNDDLPFKHIKKTGNLSKAKSDLNKRNTYMIINIPKNFNKSIKDNEPTKLNFYINESAQSSVTAGMKTVAQQVGDKISKQVIIKKGQTMLTESQLTILQNDVKAKQNELTQTVDSQKEKIAEAPAQMRPALENQLQQKSDVATAKLKDTVTSKEREIKKSVSKIYTPVSNSVEVKIHPFNKVRSGLNYSLAPFILNLSLYIGALMGTLLLYGTFAKFAKISGRFSSFAMLEIAMLLVAIIGSGVVTSSVIGMMHLNGSQFNQLWINQSLEMFAAYNLNAVLLLLLGQIGTSLNIFFTMFQVVAGGGMIPATIMNPFFHAVHYVAPMYYTVTAGFNIMYGGVGTENLWAQLGLLILALFVINLAIVTFKKRQTMINFSDLA